MRSRCWLNVEEEEERQNHQARWALRADHPCRAAVVATAPSLTTRSTFIEDKENLNHGRAGIGREAATEMMRAGGATMFPSRG